MKTDKAVDILRQAVRWVDWNADFVGADDSIDKAYDALSALESALDAKDGALKPFAIHADYLAIVSSAGVSSLTKLTAPEGYDSKSHVITAGDCYDAKAAISPPTGKVLIKIEELSEWYDSINSACGTVKHGSDDYINLACIRERLYDLKT